MRRLVDMRFWASCFVLGGLVASGVGCVDPGQHDRALAEIDAVRREAAAREGTIRAMEERQNAQNQQMTMLMAVATSSLARDPRKDDERDKRLGEIAEKLGHVEAILTRMREEEQPTPIDIAAARRAAEQGSAEERAAAILKVQTLLDAGQVKLTVKNGRMQISLLRPIDATDPYRPAKPAVATKPAEGEKLKELLDSR